MCRGHSGVWGSGWRPWLPRVTRGVDGQAAPDLMNWNPEGRNLGTPLILKVTQAVPSRFRGADWNLRESGFKEQSPVPGAGPLQVACSSGLHGRLCYWSWVRVRVLQGP